MPQKSASAVTVADRANLGHTSDARFSHGSLCSSLRFGRVPQLFRSAWSRATGILRTLPNPSGPDFKTIGDFCELFGFWIKRNDFTHSVHRKWVAKNVFSKKAEAIDSGKRSAPQCGVIPLHDTELRLVQAVRSK